MKREKNNRLRKENSKRKSHSKPPKPKPSLSTIVDVTSDCLFVTVIDTQASLIRKQMRTQAKISKIVFLCETLTEANLIYSQAESRRDFTYVYLCQCKPPALNLTKYRAGTKSYVSGKYHVTVVDKYSDWWSSWYQKKP
jgi:hypothetical protein